MNAIRPELRKGWCPGALRPMETGDGLLVRVRPRAGSFTIAGFKVIAETASAFGSGEIDLTSRANLQLRGLSEATYLDALAALGAAGLLDESASIEAVRNVVVDPLCGLDPEHVDVRGLAAELEQMLAANSDLHALPGKFGLSVSGTASPLVGQTAADISIAMPSPGRCIISLGGDQLRGAFATLADAAFAVERLATAFLAITAQHGTVRRMADAVALLGSAAIFSRAGLQTEAIDNAAPRAMAADRIGKLGPAQNPYAFGIGIPFGRINAAALHSLCELANELGCADARPSTQRSLILPVSSAAAAASLLGLAETLDLITGHDDPRLMMDVCPGAPSCRNATTSTRADAQSLVAAFEAAGRPMPAVHISGCAKGCARHSSASLTFVAHNGAYNAILDGTAGGPIVMAGITPQALANSAIRLLERTP